MKWLKLSIISLLAVCTLTFFQNCGAVGSSSSQSPNAPGNPTDAIISSSVHVEHNGDKIAYVLGIESNVATVYIPSVDRYTRINVKTGQYQKNWFYYSGPGCTGAAVISSFPGEIGKSVVFVGGKYYRVNSAYPGQFSYRSTFNEYDYPAANAPGGCTTFSSTHPIVNITYTFEEVNRPFDFESIAPLDIRFD